MSAPVSCASMILDSRVPQGPLMITAGLLSLNRVKIAPAVILYIIATVIFRIFWTPRKKPQRLEAMPIMRYLLKPRFLAMVTANGAETWNSAPGRKDGILNIPVMSRRTDKIPSDASALAEYVFLVIMVLVPLVFESRKIQDCLGGFF